MSLKGIIHFFLGLFIITTLILPVAIFNKLIFAVLLVITIYVNSISKRIVSIAPLLILLIFIYGFIISLFNSSDRQLSIQLLFSVSILFLIYIIVPYNINLNRIIKISGIILSLFTFFSYLIITSLQENIFADFFHVIFKKYSLGAIGNREFSDESIFMFHLGATPFLYLPFSLFIISFLEKRNFANLFCLVLIGVPIILSASRGLIICTFIIIILILYVYSTRMFKKFIILISIPSLIIFFNYFKSHSIVFSVNEVSNSSKIGHAKSFFENINIINFFLGDGLGSYYFSSGKNAITSETEITPLDMIRYFGFFFAGFLFMILIFPSPQVKRYINENKLYLKIFLVYLLMSFSNPVLFNSYGLIVVLWYWSKILNKNIIYNQPNPAL